jgi:hypothetical protein
MKELYFDPEASDALTRLESDPGRRQLLAKVNAVLDQLEENSGDNQSVRRNRFDNGLWCVTLYEGDEQWCVLWEPHPDVPAGLIVQYLGPSSFK